MQAGLWMGVWDSVSVSYCYSNNLLEALGENLFPGLFRFLEVACIHWLVVASAMFKINSIASSNLSFSDSPPSLL